MTIGGKIMTWKNTHQHYGKLSMGLHWLMFLIMIAVYASINLRELYPKGSDPREALKTLHFMLGLIILLLVCLRIYVKASSPTPAIVPDLSARQHLAAKLGHLALYGLMIAAPILGWLLLSAAAKPIPFFGFELPALINENKDLAKSIKKIHETVGELGYYLIAIHVVAALYHHYFKKDNTLTRMLPLKK
jgi:cytochrome b561